jgi:ferritin-like metal-binding protein YciE
VQLKSAPEIAGDPTIAADFARHYTETEGQAGLVRERLEARGGSPSAVKDAVMKVGGKGFLLFARVQPETPGRLLAHAFAYEAMEWAGYEMLCELARRAGDEKTEEAAERIAGEERAMLDRLGGHFGDAERASHGRTPAEKMREQVRKHLAEAHALEAQSLTMLRKSEEIGGSPRLARIYREHLGETEGQSRLLEARLDALGGDTSGFKDAFLKIGALNWGLFFQAQSDTPAKLAAFAYAFEHLEIGGYELLARSARRAGDDETERLCGRILEQERSMTQRLAGAFDTAVECTLAALAS